MIILRKTHTFGISGAKVLLFAEPAKNRQMTVG